MTREHPVHNADAHARAVAEYRRDGYRVTGEADRSTTLTRWSHGGLLAHLALFFTVGFWTFGLANVLYAAWARARSFDQVRVVTRRGDADRPDLERFGGNEAVVP